MRRVAVTNVCRDRSVSRDARPASANDVRMDTWVQAAATLLAVVLGGVLSVYVRGQQLVKIGEKRLDAYGPLWELTKSLRRSGPALSEEDLAVLSRQITDWYYQKGGGMLATPRTVQMFVKLRNNLTCGEEGFYPPSWQELWGGSPAGDPPPIPLLHRQRMLAQQFSLLRTQMKMDCSVYYGRHISPVPPIAPYETDFLRGLETPLGRMWRSQLKHASTRAKDAYLTVLGLPRPELRG